MASIPESKKIFFWLISTIAAAIVGYLVVQLLEKQPELEVSASVISTLKQEYSIEIRNIGDLSLRNVKGGVQFWAHYVEVDEVLLEDVTVRYSSSFMDISRPVKTRFWVSYPFLTTPGKSKWVKPTIEFELDYFEPQKALSISFCSPYNESSEFELRLFADGFRYYCVFRNKFERWDPAWHTYASRGDCQLSVE